MMRVNVSMEIKIVDEYLNLINYSCHINEKKIVFKIVLYERFL